MIPTFELGKELTSEQKEALDEVGAIRFTNVASMDEVVALRAAVEALSDQWVAEGREKVNGIPVKYGQEQSGKRFVQRFAFSSLFSDVIKEFVHDERFEPVRRLCGDDCRVGDREKDGVVVNWYRNEVGSKYKALGWHTDGLRDLAYGRMPGPMYNIGFYLDDSPKEKGALRLIPGSHKQGFLKMAFGKPYFIDHREDPREVILEAKAGDLTVHDGRLWHRVGRSELVGDESVRRTMYVPYLEGPYEPKDENSKTPIYHRLQWITAITG